MAARDFAAASSQIDSASNVSSPTESPASSPTAGGAATPVNQIDLPLTEVIKKVPDRLKSFIAKIPGETDMATFTASQLMPQLAKGSVKITFTELVEASPEGTFSSSMSDGDELIELPLALVISRLGTGSFERKSAKKAASVEPQDFFGAGRNSAAEPTVDPTPAPSAPPPPAATTFTPKFPDGPVLADNDTASAPPAFSPVAATSSPAVAPAPPAKEEAPAEEAPAAPPDKAEITLAGILKTLPTELSECLQGAAPADATVEFSAAALLPQLAKGRITVTFAELIEAAPDGTFTNTAGYEQTAVSLPLGEVLAKVGPGAFKRKTPSKQLAPASDQKFFGGLAKPAEEQPPASIEPKPSGGQTTFSSQTTFQPAPPESAPAEKPMFAPSAGGKTFTAEPAAPPPSPPAETEPVGQKFQPEPVAPDSPATATKKSEESATEVPVLLTDLTPKFPDGLKAEIAKLPSNSVIMFPAEELGQAMKSAKIRFTWSQLRHWMLPKSNYASAAWEGTQVEIPLKAVVGPFMAAMRGQPPKVEVPSGSGAVQSPAATTPNHPSPAAAAPYQAEPFVPGKPKAEFAPVPQQPEPMDGPVGSPATEPEPTDSNLSNLLGQPDKKAWTPVEIVQHVGNIEGVGGAMLSLSEGQIAAAAIGVDVKTDLIAFRVPRLLAQVAEHVEQMQLGTSTYASFAAADVQWISFQLGNIFFTVHGRKGENLPVTRLEAIAAEVARRK